MKDFLAISVAAIVGANLRFLLSRLAAREFGRGEFAGFNGLAGRGRLEADVALEYKIDPVIGHVFGHEGDGMRFGLDCFGE